MDYSEKHKISIKSKFLLNPEKLFEDVMICPSCKDILNDPVSCENCEVNYCSECFDIFEKNKYKCVNNCKLVKKSASKLLFRILSELVFECAYKKEGCSEKIKYNNYIYHLKNCQFSKSTCRGCKMEIVRKEMNAHEESCELIEIICEGGCETMLKRSEKIKHDSFMCLRNFFEKSVIKLHDEINFLRQTKAENESTIEKLVKTVELLKSEINDIKHTLEQNNIYHQSELLNVFRCKSNPGEMLNTQAVNNGFEGKNNRVNDSQKEVKFDLLAKGFKIVYLKSYQHKTSFDELISIRNQCKKESLICVGARLKNTDLLGLCCIDIAHDVLTETHNTSFAEKRKEAYWYLHNGYGFGFSKIAKIRLCLPDAEDELGEYRLSWRLTGSDGYRIGMVKDPGDSYEKIILIFE